MRLESLPGLVLDQKYRIERALGVGAMGAVFRATHLGTTRPVALKVIMPKLADNQEFGQRFKREAEAAGRLIHPNVVNVTDFGVTLVEQRELAYLVMEYLDGLSLADYLKETPRPTFNFVLEVMEQAGLALDASHAAGIVHRDLKPNNIWLEPDHRGGYNVKVLDFGIAKVIGPTKEERAIAADAIATVVMQSEPDASLTFVMEEGEDSSLNPSTLKTSFGTLLGTPAYMAPEQCAGMDVNAAADVYSLAAIAYQMLCGRLPFEADNFKELIRQQIQTVPPSPRDFDKTVPEVLAKVVLCGLEKDPARRPPTAGTFAARLRAASDGELGLIRKSKDVFHTHPSSFMPVLLACLGVVMILLIPVQSLAAWAARAKVAPDVLLVVLMSCCFVLLMVFAFQLFKAACAIMLLYASQKGQFQSARGYALKALGAGLPDLVRTQLVSMIDLRPSSFWANLLWPVVWAVERRSGKDAIARSRQLCFALPAASKSLMVRQYAPALMGTLLFPAIWAMVDSTGGMLHQVVKEELAGSLLGWISILYQLVFAMFILNFGPAISFLYWSALRCRNEGAEITLPPAARDDNRQSAARAVRPGTLIWLGLPLVMLVLIAWRASAPATIRAMDDASDDGRGAALLKLFDAGLSVEQLTSGHETALFDAVRLGDEKLAAELLKRGAHVNVQNLAGNTPVLIAAKLGRNELARLLLDHGAQADASNREGRTALMVAAMRGNATLAHILLEHGANLKRVDTHGKTATDYAGEEGFGELAMLLK